MRKVADWLNRLAERHGERVHFDPGQLKDKLAEAIPWTPLKPGGSNFATHQLRRQGSHRLVYTISKTGLFFCLAFLVSGLIISAFSALFLSRDNEGFSMVIPLLVGLLFAGVGAGMLFSMARPMVFDLEAGFYWCGWRDRRKSGDLEGKGLRLNCIHALQIISEYCGSDSVYHSYELNLVLVNGQRLNLIDHGKISLIQQEAEELGRFLDVPVWDASRLAMND